MDTREKHESSAHLNIEEIKFDSYRTSCLIVRHLHIFMSRGTCIHKLSRISLAVGRRNYFLERDDLFMNYILGTVFFTFIIARLIQSEIRFFRV